MLEKGKKFCSVLCLPYPLICVKFFNLRIAHNENVVIEFYKSVQYSVPYALPEVLEKIRMNF